MTVELAPLKPSSRFEFDAANEVDEDEQEEDGEEGEEEEEDLENDDFEIAFEVLDVARVIYDLMLKGEIEKDVSDLGFEGKGKEKLDVDLIIKEKLSDVILTLADVGLESESFSQAIEDYQTALAMKSEFLSPGNRSLAETHYKLALAIEYGCQPLELALEHLKASRSVMLTRKAELGPSSFAESAEIEELVAELNLKIEDIEQQIYLRDHPVEKEKTEDLHPKNIDLAEVSNINDLSGFVKKKSVVATSHNSSASEESKRKRSLDEIDDESLAKDPSQHQESLKHVRLE